MKTGLVGLVAVLVGGAAGITVSHQSEPTKPIWPSEFSAPFGLFSTFPYISNASSWIFYSYTNEKRGMVIDFKERCTPFSNIDSLLFGVPCKIWIMPDGMYFAQPTRGVRCCTYRKDKTTPNPDFLAGFSLVESDAKIEDLWGQPRDTQLWQAADPLLLKYWTVPPGDTVHVGAEGQPLAFEDKTGVVWRWGLVRGEPQPASIFELPASKDECAQPCPWYGGEVSPSEERSFGIDRIRQLTPVTAAYNEAPSAKDECKPHEDEGSCQSETGCQWCVTIDLEWCQTAKRKCKE